MLRIKTITVKKIAEYDSQIYLNIAENLARKAIKEGVRAQILRLPGVKCRVAKLFVELLNERKTDPTIQDYPVVNGTFHQQDIAAYLGCGNRSTGDAIRELVGANLIKQYDHDQSGRFCILDKTKLTAYVEAERLAAMDRKRPNNTD